MAQHASVPNDVESGRAAIGTAVWVALVGGLAEVAILLVMRGRQPLMRLSDDFVWMAAAALVFVTLLISVPAAAAARLLRFRAGWGFSVFVASLLATLNLLMLVRGLSHAAALLLATGAGVQVLRLYRRRPRQSLRLVRRSTMLVIGCIVLVGYAACRGSARPKTDGTQATGSARDGRRPNVLLVTLDTVRAASLSLYRYHRPTTPNLDRFAERSVVFDRAFATAPWTLPSHASLFTGRWPHELSTGYESPLDATHPTLAEYLAGHGYATAGFAANLGFCSYRTGLGRGFSHYEDYPRSVGQMASTSTLVRNVADNFKVRRILRNDQHLNRVTAADLNARVLDWFSRRSASSPPFFVFINYFDAHEPYLPSPPYDTRFGPGRALGRYSPLHHWLWDVSVGHEPISADEIREEIDAYDGAVTALDDHLGRLLDELSRRDLLDETLVIITSDHGEEFGEHGLFDHGYSVYRQALQVPLVIARPGQVPARRIATPVTLRDIPATIAEMLGLESGSPFPGKSLAREWSAPPGGNDDRSAVFSEVTRATGQPAWFPVSKGDLKSAFFRGFHYIRNGDGSEELYDAERDPAERDDLSRFPAYQGRLVEGRQLLREFDLRSATSQP